MFYSDLFGDVSVVIFMSAFTVLPLTIFTYMFCACLNLICNVLPL